MALKGNIKDFSITQLLNLINLARKTGTLIVEGPSNTAWISFRDGKLAYSQIGNGDNTLAAILYRSKMISKNQYRVIRDRAAEMSDKELGLLLINANYLTQEDILKSLHTEFTSIIQRLFSWVEGQFKFENNVLPPNGKITLKINLENIIIDGSRKFKEWEHLRDELPSLDMALKFANRPGSNLKNINLNVEEWRVVSYITPKNSMRQIANTVKMNDLEIRRVIYSLLQAGIVEIVKPAALEEKQRLPVSLPKSKKEKAEQKSLVNKLIRRIRSL